MSGRRGKIDRLQTQRDEVRIENYALQKELRRISKKPVRISTDCRSEIGITVGIIDSIIFMARILKERNLQSFEINEALKDLQSDEDVKLLLTIPTL